jgi:hypothetical protein
MRHPRRAVTLSAFLGVAIAQAAFAGTGDQIRVPATPNDFLLPGTQPNPDAMTFEPIHHSNNCSYCHGSYSLQVAPFDSWITSMKAQAARDPIWHAALAIANQDVSNVGELCIRCHAPGAWLAGNAATSDLSQFTPDDFDAINCHFCHRLVSPVAGPLSAVGYPANADPTPDPEILDALIATGDLPGVRQGAATYVVDPHDVRRGPFADVPMNFHGAEAELIHSPFHSDSSHCGTCHDVSNPVFTRGADGQMHLNALGAEHPTMNPDQMFPEQRTYSEWLNSTFATTGVSFPDDRFGGNHPTGVMKTCQDCHMPDQYGGGCVFYDGDPATERPNVPQHSFAGANTWVIRAIASRMGDDADWYGLTPERVDASVARNIQMLKDASDMSLAQVGSQLAVTITNQSGHKLPTGYPEGRRAWISVRFLSSSGAIIGEIGGYDHATATLNLAGTKIYETRQVLNAEVAAATNLPVGSGFHLALASEVAFDNRIPPRGFTNAAFAAIGSGPIGYSYADGQYWDTTTFAIPAGATSAVVSFNYQTSTREYMEFLRDTAADGSGLLAYNLWVQHGRSAPVVMDTATLNLSPSQPADLNGDGLVNGADITVLFANWGGTGQGDVNGDGIVNATDLTAVLANWS